MTPESGITIAEAIILLVSAWISGVTLGTVFGFTKTAFLNWFN